MELTIRLENISLDDAGDLKLYLQRRNISYVEITPSIGPKISKWPYEDMIGPAICPPQKREEWLNAEWIIPCLHDTVGNRGELYGLSCNCPKCSPQC